MKRIAFAALAGAVLGLMIGCGDDEVEPTGTGQVRGNVESFENIAVVSAYFAVPATKPERILAAVGGVTVYLDGPVSRTTTTDASGSFSFTDLPPGSYTLTFEYNGEEISYRGDSGQLATLTVENDQRIEVVSVTVSGGHANIGNIKVVLLDANGNPIEPEPKPEPEPDPEPDSDPEPEPEPDPLIVAPINPATAQGGTQPFIAVGGVPPYAWTVSKPSLGTISVSATNAVVYTGNTTGLTGANVVTVWDQRTNSASTVVDQW